MKLKNKKLLRFAVICSFFVIIFSFSVDALNFSAQSTQPNNFPGAPTSLPSIVGNVPAGQISASYMNKEMFSFLTSYVFETFGAYPYYLINAHQTGGTLIIAYMTDDAYVTNISSSSFTVNASTILYFFTYNSGIFGPFTDNQLFYSLTVTAQSGSPYWYHNLNDSTGKAFSPANFSSGYGSYINNTNNNKYNYSGFAWYDFMYRANQVGLEEEALWYIYDLCYDISYELNQAVSLLDIIRSMTGSINGQVITTNNNLVKIYNELLNMSDSINSMFSQNNASYNVLSNILTTLNRLNETLFNVQLSPNMTNIYSNQNYVSALDNINSIRQIAQSYDPLADTSTYFRNYVNDINAIAVDSSLSDDDRTVAQNLLYKELTFATSEMMASRNEYVNQVISNGNGDTLQGNSLDYMDTEQEIINSLLDRVDWEDLNDMIDIFNSTITPTAILQMQNTFWRFFNWKGVAPFVLLPIVLMLIISAIGGINAGINYIKYGH